MSYIDKAFDKLKSNLEITPTEQGLAQTRHKRIREHIESATLKMYIGTLNAETFERGPTSLFGFAHGQSFMRLRIVRHNTCFQSRLTSRFTNI